MSTMTAQLAAAICNRAPDAVPAALLHEAKRLTLDFFGVGLAGSRTDSGEISARFAVRQGGSPQASLFSEPTRVTAVNAAFANAIASHSIELDDVDEEALFHHGPPIVATAVAAGQLAHASGPELLAAIVAGCETMTRLSQATNPQLRNRAFHTTPTTGVFGATMAAAVLLGLSVEQTVDALGLAGAQASGLMEMYGTSMQKRFNPGPAARNGLTAALFAQDGFTGADSIIEGERGFATAFAGHFDAERFLAGLGSQIPMAVEYKPYSCARPIHNAIDAMLELRDAGLTADAVSEIAMYRHPAWAHYHLLNAPRTFHEAQVSLPYSAALALVRGRALPADYETVGCGDDEVMGLAGKMSIIPDDSLERGVSVRAVVTTTVGETLTATVDHPLGSLQRPLGDDQLEQKFADLAGPVIGEQMRELAEAVWVLDGCGDINDLMALTSQVAR